jgi:lipoyl(octanoyl) transferase
VDLRVEWLGRIEYRRAWALQHELVAARAADRIPDTLLLLEHPGVLTLGRHADPRHVLASPDTLRQLGVELLEVERGGEVTYHGPGQLVAYPVLKLAARGLMLRPLVRALEGAMADVSAGYGVPAGRRDGFPGCWVDAGAARPRKLGALGLRVERGVTYHGIGLNITTDLAGFDLIEPCGLDGIDVTSIAREAGWSGSLAVPSTSSVMEAGQRFAGALQGRLRDAAADRARADRASGDGAPGRGPSDPEPADGAAGPGALEAVLQAATSMA